MATYTPAAHIESKAFGNGAGNISTWRKQNTAGASTFDIHRTTVVESASASRTVTIEEGAVAADTAAQKIVDAFGLTASVTQVWNWWVAVPNNSYFEGFANNTDIVGASFGYTYG